MILISIIVPIYKAESFLSRCVDSVLAQTYHDWELLLVDDGSPDNSGAICDKYAAKDSRIKVFHKPNGGVSSARNLGLDNAKGEWISFVDADDYISPNYLEAVMEDNCDLVFVQKRIHKIDNTLADNNTISFPRSIGPEEYKTILADNLSFGQFKAPWGKFIKRNCIGNIRFVVGQKIGEDTVFMLEVYARCSSITISSNAYYYWQESETVDIVKYKLNVKDAIEFSSRIFRRYEDLKIKSLSFEKFILAYFFWIMSKERFWQLHAWFSNDVIERYYNRIYLGIGLPKHIWLWKHFPMCAYAVMKLKRML